MSVTRQIYESPIWPKFQPLFLKTNCRQSQNPEYGQLLNRIRVGQHSMSDIELLQTRICRQGHPMNDSGRNITASSSMVICSKHKKRLQINDEIQSSLFPEKQVYELHARDCDISGNHVSSQETQLVNEVKSVLPQCISVREGVKVMITRNLNIQERVVNGTIGVLQKNHPKVLMIQRLDSDELIPVTKVKQKIGIPFYKIPVYRVQFLHYRHPV